MLVQHQVARFHDGEEREDGGLVVLALHVAKVLVVLVHGVLDQSRGDAWAQEAEVLDVEGYLLLPLPRRQQVLDVIVGAQQPGTAAGIPHLAPLAHQLAGIPVDALARLLVEVQADAVDVSGDFLVAVTFGAAHQGRKGIPDFLPLDVGHYGFEVAGPGQVFDAAADGGLVIRRPGSEQVEGQGILQGLGHGCRGLPVHVLDKTAQPPQVVPDGPVELGSAVADNAMVGHALVELGRQFKRRLKPRRRLCHPGALDLERLHFVGQRQRLQKQELNGKLLGSPRGVHQVLAQVGHHGCLGVRNSPFQALQQLCSRCCGPCGRPPVQRRRPALQTGPENKPRRVLDLLGDTGGAGHGRLHGGGHAFKFTG